MSQNIISPYRSLSCEGSRYFLKLSIAAEKKFVFVVVFRVNNKTFFFQTPSQLCSLYIRASVSEKIQSKMHHYRQVKELSHISWSYCWIIKGKHLAAMEELKRVWRQNEPLKWKKKKFFFIIVVMMLNLLHALVDWA